MLQLEQQKKLHEWVAIRKRWQLVYKATRDGFGGTDFHRTCDGKGENLGVIKSSNGFLFGWWTPISWKSTGSIYEYTADASTFIFTLTNPADVPAKYKIKDARYALCHYSTFGPTLGNGHDIYVPNNSNTNAGCTNFPDSYDDTTGRGNNTFTGNRNFTVSEIEVFLAV